MTSPLAKVLAAMTAPGTVVSHYRILEKLGES